MSRSAFVIVRLQYSCLDNDGTGHGGNKVQIPARSLVCSMLSRTFTDGLPVSFLYCDINLEAFVRGSGLHVVRGVELVCHS